MKRTSLIIAIVLAIFCSKTFAQKSDTDQRETLILWSQSGNKTTPMFTTHMPGF
jgi:uncharacterized protein YxeA